MFELKPINVELLLSHNNGISNSYYRPTDTELLEDYLEVADFYLTIDSQERLQNELSNIEKKMQDET
jgi:predicted DNA-binding protein